MDKRKLGKIEVSPIGMGTMGFSHGYGKIPEESYSIEAIRDAYDYGCTFFDTAEVYSPNLAGIGHNELIVGKALKPMRDDVVIATKLHTQTEEPKQDGSMYKTLKRHLEGSLKRLDTDYVDLYYWHRVNNDLSLEEVAEGMGRLIDEGLIRGWGLSQVGADTLAKAHEVTPVSAVQNLYNMLERDCEAEVFPYALENGIAVVPFSPIASGLLSGKITPDTEFEKFDDVRNWVPQLSRENIIGNQPVIELLSDFAKQKDATNAQISLAWMLKKYPNVVPIPGSKNKERIIENLGAWNVELSDEEFKALEEALNNLDIYGHRGILEHQGTVFTPRS